MKIVDTLQIDNKIYAYCRGDDIPATIDASSINVNGINLQIGKYEMMVSISGEKSAIIELPDVKIYDIPYGDITINDKQLEAVGE